MKLADLQGEDCYYQAKKDRRYYGKVTAIYPDGRAEIVVIDAGFTNGLWTLKDIPFGTPGAVGAWCFKKIPDQLLAAFNSLLYPEKEEAPAQEETAPTKEPSPFAADTTQDRKPAIKSSRL